MEAPELIRLLRQRRNEMLEALDACEAALPTQQRTQYAHQLDFLRGLIQLDLDRALLPYLQNHEE